MRHRVSLLTSRILQVRTLSSILLALLIALTITFKPSNAYSKEFTPTDVPDGFSPSLNSFSWEPDSSGTSSDEEDCQSDVDLRTWIQEGVPSNGNWQVSVDPVSGIGRSVYQTINHDPTFFVSPDSYMNVKIRGTIRIEDDWDNDFVGFVFGYNGPTESQGVTDYDFLLFDWRKEMQNQEGRRGEEGMSLYKVKGDLDGFENMYNHFWQHDHVDGKFEQQAISWGDDKGWEYNTDYHFVLVYTSTRVTIYINDELVFDVPGCFKTGRFGFYNFSQQKVRYSDFSYSLETNFEVKGDVCLGQPAQFIFADSCYGVDNTTANLARWEWDFGDGNTSTEVNPQHIYQQPGTYEVSLYVEDKNGCTDEVVKEVTILPPASPIALDDLVLCEGEIETLDVTASGVTSYLWQDGDTSSTYTISEPGTYWVETSNGSCTFRDSFEVTYVPTLRDLNLGESLQFCEGEFQLLDASLPGAETYLWQDGTTTATYEVRYPGTYQVSVSNACGEQRATVEVAVQEKPILSVGDQASMCFGESLDLRAEVENDEFATTYEWAPTGDTTQQITVSPSQNSVYTVSATNACGTTTAVQKVFVTPELEVNMLAQDPLCADSQDGRINVDVTGGAGGFTYEWAHGAGNVASLDGLAGGTYSLRVVDELGCEGSQTVSLTQPEALVLSVAAKEDVSCYGEANGSIALNVTGGTPGYAFSLNGGAFTETARFDQLPAGMHTIELRDLNQCTEKLEITLEQPEEALLANVVEARDISCFEAEDGRLELAASGGTAPYTYSLDGEAFTTQATFEGLAAGTYELYIKDARDCQVALTEALTQPEALTLRAEVEQDIECFGNENGIITAVAEGGVAPYELNWANGLGSDATLTSLGAATYQVHVIDQNGCEAQAEATLTEPEAMHALLDTLADAACFGEPSGLAHVSVQGGVAPYAYEWQRDNETMMGSALMTGLAAGDYAVRITDSRGCDVQLDDILIGEPTQISMSFQHTDLSCFEANDGAAVVNVNGGAAPYAFSWNGHAPQSSANVRGLEAGTHRVRVIDAAGCEATGEVVVNQPAPIELEVVDVNNAYCDKPNGSALVAASGGGSQEFSYIWNTTPIQGSALAMHLGKGRYTVTATDTKGCSASLEVKIDNSLPPLAEFTHNHVGKDSVQLKYATFDFRNLSMGAQSYEWDFGDGSGISTEPHPTHTFPDTGRYTVTLTAHDAFNSCPAVYSMDLRVFHGGKIFTPNAFTPNEDGINDVWFVKGEGLSNMELIIFDRWGLELKRIRSLEEGWNGKNKHGRDVQEGVYVYLLNATLNTGTPVKRGGTITLIR